MIEKENSLPIALPNSIFLLTFTLVSFLCFTIPFSLGHPQIIVGTIVNAGLFLAAVFFPEKFIYPVIFMPSLAVLSRGLIFGPLTHFLFFVIPFIWLANYLLVFIFKRLFNLKQNYWLVVILSSLAKFLFLFFSAFILVNLKFIPKIFLMTMGMMQFITAFLGGAVAFLAKQLIKSHSCPEKG